MSGEDYTVTITGDSNESNLVIASAGGVIDTATDLSLANAVAVNTETIATNASAIATNVSAIATNASAIATNASAIATNASAIAANESYITTNAATALNNLNDISGNAAAAAANAAGISASALLISNLYSEIAVTPGVVSISNDLVVNGKITENAGNDPNFVDYWSGFWGNLGYYYRNAALILQPDQTYDLWLSDNDTYQVPLTRARRGITPSLGGKQLFFAHPFFGNVILHIKSLYTGNSDDDNEAYNVYRPGPGGSMFKISTPGNSGSPSDPVKFIEEYNLLANENINKRLFNLDSLFDLKNTWEEIKNHTNQSNSSKRTLKLQCSERLIASNIHQKSAVEAAVHHDKLGTSLITYDYNLLSIATADLSGTNNVSTNVGKLLVTKYDFRKANEQNKIMLFDHVKISGTGTELDNVPHFKVSKLMHGGYSNAILGAQLDEMNFQVALRSPIKLDTDEPLSVVYKNKTFNIVVKAGYYYPSELALDITQKLQVKGCNLKVLLLNDLNVSDISSQYFSDDQSHYIIVSETEHVVSVSGGPLVNNMKLDSLTIDVSGSPLLNSGKKFFIHKGGFGITRFTPMHFDLSSIPADAKISVTHGNATITDSPRNYYATVVDLVFESFFEEHANFNFKVSLDIDGEYYVPETWELYEMYIDDNFNFNKIILSESAQTTINHRQLLNTPSPEYSVGIAGPAGKSGTNLELNASKRFTAPYATLFNPEIAEKLYENGGFSHKNYLETTYQFVKEEIYSLAADGVVAKCSFNFES